MITMFRPFAAFETPADGGSGAPTTVSVEAAQTAATQAPAAQTPPPAPAAPEQQQPPAEQQQQAAGPWAADLERYFEDEGARSAADRYMREVVQPRSTQLEQELSQLREAIGDGEPIQLFNDLLTSPRETLAVLAQELFADPEDKDNYDPDLAGQLAGLFGGEQAPEQQGTPQEGHDDAAAAVKDGTIQLDQLPPEVRQIVEERLAAEQADEYNRVVDSFLEQHPQLTAEDKDYLHPWIVQTQGDLDQAAQNFLYYRESLQRQAGLLPEQQPEPNVPPVAGSSSTTAPPAGKAYDSWDQFDDAIGDFLHTQRQGNPPPVGSV